MLNFIKNLLVFKEIEAKDPQKLWLFRKLPKHYWFWNSHLSKNPREEETEVRVWLLFLYKVNLHMFV